MERRGDDRVMDRRKLSRALVALLAAPPIAALARSPGTRRIGYLGNGSPAAMSTQLGALRRGLQESGWVEGRNLTVEYRWAHGDPARLPVLVAELARARVELIVLSGTAAIRAAKETPRTPPIVFVVLSDPAASGLVSSLARPGGNMTGLSSQFEELIAKQLQLLKEVVPDLSRVALLQPLEIAPRVIEAAEAAGLSLGLTTRRIGAASAADFEGAFETARKDRAGAMQVLPSPYFSAHRARLIELAARYRLPAFYEFRSYVQEGGLISYGPSIDDMWVRSARYIDRILKGADPATLPIEQAAKFELAINLKTAAALGLTISPGLLQRADEVIR
jgi:putative ABC transport system substrate-binding protein